MVRIVLKNISKRFQNVTAVNNVNLEVQDGEFLVLLGPSGCGKTTTLRMIAGLEKQTVGDLYFDDKLVNDLEPKQRNVAMVFQEYALYPHMTVSDNLSLCLKVAKVGKEEMSDRLLRVAKMLEIEHLLGRKPGELSGGQQQRVALGRAIIREPSVFLLDEPLSNLDAILRVSMRVELKKLQQKLGTTTVYVTHDQTEAMIMADRVAVMKDGDLLQIGSPVEVYTRPATKFIGEFVGPRSMNLIECDLVDKEEGAFLDFGSFSLRVPTKLMAAVRDRPSDSGLVMGIRPEHVEIKNSKDEDSVRGELYLVQRLGDTNYVSVSIGSNLITAKTDPREEFRDEIFVKFNLGLMNIFDRKTGKIII